MIEVEFAGQYFKGDKGLNWKGVYVNTTAYLKDDAVSYNGSSYVALQNSTGNLPTNTSFWSILAQKGENGANPTVSSVNGLIGDVVITANTISAATASQGAKADTAVQPAELNLKTDKSVSLLSWAYGNMFQLVSSTRDPNGAIVTANIIWPDGISGVFTTDVASTAFPGAIDAWHATYVASPSKLITQPAVTRDLNGAVTSQPAITVV